MTATTMIVITTLTFFVKTILTKKLWFVKPEISLSALPYDILKVSAISQNFNLRSPKTILWTFIMFSRITPDFWGPERSVLSVFI